MTIVEYINDPQDKPRSYHPKTIPSYITDAGHWMNPDGSEKMIGVGVEGSIPDSVGTLTLEELQARQRAIHAKYPMLKDPMDMDAGNMTDEQVDTMIADWWNAR